MLENVHPAWVSELVEARARRGWRLAVVSSGFRGLIEPVLEREGSRTSSSLQRGRPRPGRLEGAVPGLRGLRDLRPACKRSTAAALADGSELVYVGDGYSDRCAAGSADLVFARRGLAGYLEERGVPFERFEDFHSVARRLAS